MSEGSDKAKNKINMKSILLTAIFIFILLFVARRRFLSVIPVFTMFTLFLAKFSKNEKVKEFFYQKFDQEKTKVTENIQFLKDSISKLTIIKVSVQENAA